jgi:hypothetical protein
MGRDQAAHANIAELRFVGLIGGEARETPVCMDDGDIQ